MPSMILRVQLLLQQTSHNPSSLYKFGSPFLLQRQTPLEALVNILEKNCTQQVQRLCMERLENITTHILTLFANYFRKRENDQNSKK
jgi:hypothetical protein